MLSPSSAVKSAKDGASDVIVTADCVDNLDALEARLVLVFLGAGLGRSRSWKKVQSGDLLKCSSLSYLVPEACEWKVRWRLTWAYLMAPSHPVLDRNNYTRPYHRIHSLAHTSSQRLPAILFSADNSLRKTRVDSYLFNLAFPTLLALMRPLIRKCGFPCVVDFLDSWIFLIDIH